MPTTLYKIADLANVSPTTVSFVLNGKGRISADVTKRVLSIARETGYPISNRRQSSGTKSAARDFVFVVPDIEPETSHQAWDYFVSTLFRHAHRHLSMAGHRLFEASESRLVEALGTTGNFSGSLLVYCQDPLPEIIDQKPNVSLFQPGARSSTVLSVEIDDEAVGGLAFQALAARHPQLPFVFLDPTGGRCEVERRLFGARMAARAMGAPAVHHIQSREHGTPLEDNRLNDETLDRLLQETSWPCSLFATSGEYFALDVVRRLSIHGKEHGRDYQLATVIAQLSNAQILPPGTILLDLMIEEQSRAAVSLLLERLEGTRIHPTRTLVQPTLRADQPGDAA